MNDLPRVLDEKFQQLELLVRQLHGAFRVGGGVPDEVHAEPADPVLSEYYEQLLSALRHPAVRDGQWRLLDSIPAWEGNWTWDCFIAFAWQGADGRSLLAAVNYALNHSQCYVRWPFAGLSDQTVCLSDLLGSAVYERRGSDLQAHGLYLDLPAWGYHLFEVTAI